MAEALKQIHWTSFFALTSSFFALTSHWNVHCQYLSAELLLSISQREQQISSSCAGYINIVPSKPVKQTLQKEQLMIVRQWRCPRRRKPPNGSFAPVDGALPLCILSSYLSHADPAHLEIQKLAEKIHMHVLTIYKGNEWEQNGTHGF